MRRLPLLASLSRDRRTDGKRWNLEPPGVSFGPTVAGVAVFPLPADLPGRRGPLRSNGNLPPIDLTSLQGGRNYRILQRFLLA